MENKFKTSPTPYLRDILKLLDKQEPIREVVIYKGCTPGPTSFDAVLLGVYRCQNCGEQFQVNSYFDKCSCGTTVHENNKLYRALNKSGSAE